MLLIAQKYKKLRIISLFENISLLINWNSPTQNDSKANISIEKKAL